MKLAAHHKQQITHLYVSGWSSPLEIAEELGLTFRQVCNYIEAACLRKIITMVARDVRKATRADSYIPEDRGFEPPKWRL